MKSHEAPRCKKLITQWMPILLLFIASLGIQGCKSTQTVSLDSQNTSTPFGHPVIQTRDKVEHQKPFQSNLPLGIGARMDVFVANTASGVSDLYDSYVKPLRNGKIFNRQPYQVDYSLLPKKGSAFNKKGNMLNSLSIRSDYKLQVGMSRRISNYSSLLNPAFWLAIGDYTNSIPTIEHRRSNFNPASIGLNQEEKVKFDLDYTPDIDVDSILRERWGLLKP